MKNLLDQVVQISRSVLSRQIAEMEVYRIPQYIFMILSNVCFYIMNFLGLFIKECKEKAESMEKLTFDSQLQKTELDVMRNAASFEAILHKNIRYHIQNSLYCLLSKKASTDEVSAKITKAASNIVSKKEITGKSVYEINDSVYRRYADKKKHEYKEYLRLWLFLAVFIVMGGAAAMIFRQIPFKYIFGLTVILELANYLFAARILSIWHMAKFVWIVKAEAGSGSSEIYDYPVSSLKTDELHLMDLRMRTLHTLIASANVLLQEQKTLENQIASDQKQLEKNLEKIRLLGKERTDENKRMIYSIQEENAHLKNMIDETAEKIESRKKEYKNTASLISVLMEWLIPAFREKWNGSYRRLQISNKALKDVICSFSMEDVKGIEKRFYEIDNTSDPKAIAKKKNGMYCFEFLTAQGGVASLTFDAASQNGHFCIQSVSREEKLTEPFVTNEELAEVISSLKVNQSMDDTYKKQTEELKKWYQTESQKWEAQKKQLEAKNKNLSDEKKKLSDEIGNQQTQIQKLSDEICQKTKDCEQLKALLDQYTREGDAVQTEKIRQALKSYEQQLEKLQNEYRKKLSEIEKLYVQISSLNEKQKEIMRELNLKQNELSEAKEHVTRCNSIIEQKKTEIDSLSDKIQDRDNQIVTLNGLLKKAESATDAKKETLKKLENSKKKLEEEKKLLTSEIQDKNKTISQMRIETERADQMIATQKKDMIKLQQEIEDSFSEILYDEEIYEKLYEWIQSAQQYIYIISPFVKKYQFSVMKQKLKAAVIQHPDLKIKILYGIKDTNFRGEFQDPDNIMKSREFMRQLQEILGDALMVRETNTHDKLVIVDDQKFMLGSANVMSFSGDYAKKQGLHSEIVICSKNRKQLIELKNRFFRW